MKLNDMTNEQQQVLFANVKKTLGVDHPWLSTDSDGRIAVFEQGFIQTYNKHTKRTVVNDRGLTFIAHVTHTGEIYELRQ